ncbi:MAG: decaprenylphospho-beta-D-ribofuranose 2-oxidase [Myxococcota bacterium]|jgi:decaprenylphospho-beta-D-ribofuranose 2-oxidase
MRALLLSLLLTACSGEPTPIEDTNLIDDVSRLNATTAARIVHPKTEAEIVAALSEARSEGRRVSISGARHSQGAHAFGTDHVVIDMTGYSQILSIDAETRRIRLQAGARWDDIQNAVNDAELAVLTMQSSNIFTVGGSISANIHGRDPQASVIIDTILSMRLLQPDGSITDLTPSDDLFPLVVGGYGLFGVILEAELQLTDNRVLAKEARMMDYTEFPAFFEEHIRDSPVRLFIARPSIASSTLLRETAVTTWSVTDEPLTDTLRPLGQEENILRDRLLFGDSRRSSGGKERRWALQKAVIARPGVKTLVTRNNAMRPPTTPLEFLNYDSDDDTDIVQEYYVPIRHFVAFADAVRKIVEAQEVNLLGVTIRFVEGKNDAFLSYADEDCFSFMLYTNQRLDTEGRERAAKMTRDLVDAALALDGRHYLAYQRWPTPAQLRLAYPRIDEFFALKKSHDPEGVFSSGFYRHYSP